MISPVRGPIVGFSGGGIGELLAIIEDIEGRLLTIVVANETGERKKLDSRTWNPRCSTIQPDHYCTHQSGIDGSREKGTLHS
jgi:hypothetical protein